MLRIESTNAEVNAMCAVYAEKARARALSVSTDTLLAGLPIVIKDTFDVEGLVTTHGSKLWEQVRFLVVSVCRNALLSSTT